MSLRVVVINTHCGANPLFAHGLERCLRSLGVQPQIRDGREGSGVLEDDPERILLTGVPLDAGYSLSQGETQVRVGEHFGWLRSCARPVLGICYGHQILAHVFGGRVAAGPRTVRDPKHRLVLREQSALFEGTHSLRVFAEHRDYVSAVPRGFRVLAECQGVPYVIHDAQRHAYGVQFVPELSGKRGRELLRRFIDTRAL